MMKSISQNDVLALLRHLDDVLKQRESEKYESKKTVQPS
jgi:hypothetical protein